ncbi:putative lipoprotein [Clostridium putrefaciens]|uniref:Putative lipoprotein n=1 Tax=Clostridium putrefaciens TaxID=99675 RepID=A0A381JAY2_9CLOT|nr:hypothetical protein [Clostridium putrefaciens]SUY48414.1 putative lipoprotein [Clostridium putrefaciens]
MSLITIPDHLVGTVISALAIILGTLIGAFCSWVISSKNTKKSIEEQYRIMKENIKYEEIYKKQKLCENANMIRLDICTTIFQSIRFLRDNKGCIERQYPIPINKDYSCVVSSLSDKYSLKELSYIYQLYGIIEKLNFDILNCSTCEDSCNFNKICEGYKSVLVKLYGEDFKSILKVDIEKISYEELYNNKHIKEGYKKVLKRLDHLCFVENLNKSSEKE